MAKITLSPILPGYASTTQLNANFAEIASQLNGNVLYRDNPAGNINLMQNDLDMNSFDLLNIKGLQAESLLIANTDVIIVVTALAGNAASSAVSANTSAAAALVSEIAAANSAASIADPLLISQNLGDLGNVTLAQSNLQLGNAALANTGISVGQVLSFSVTGQLPALDGSLLTGIGTGDLLSTNNLSDVASATTSRTNLGLGNVATFDVGVGNTNICQFDAVGYPAADGSQITGIAAADNFSSQLFHARQEASSTTDGGSSVVGRQVRVIDTVLTNEIIGAVLATNRVSLPAGDYYIAATAPMYQTLAGHLIIRNFTDSADEIIGDSGFAGSADAVTHVFVTGRFTIAATKEIELEHFTNLVTATTGLGRQAATDISVYADIKIWKVG